MLEIMIIIIIKFRVIDGEYVVKISLNMSVKVKSCRFVNVRRKISLTIISKKRFLSHLLI